MGMYNFKVYDILTPVFRVSFPKLAEASELSKKFEVDAIFETTADFSKMWQAVQEVFANNGIPNTAPYTWLKDGNSKIDKETKQVMKGYENKVYLTLRAANAIGTCKQLPDGSSQDCDATEIYGGCYAIASIVCYGYDHPSTGVTFAVNHIMKIGEGESFGGGVHKASQAFSNVGAIALPAGAAPLSNAAPMPQGLPAPMAAPMGMPAPNAAPMPMAAPMGMPAPNAAPMPMAAPAPMAAPIPPAPAPAAPNAAPQVQMTAKANGVPYESFIQQGWTYDTMLANGYITVQPTQFAQQAMAPLPPR